jgi:hypothetical protein
MANPEPLLARLVDGAVLKQRRAVQAKSFSICRSRQTIAGSGIGVRDSLLAAEIRQPTPLVPCDGCRPPNERPSQQIIEFYPVGLCEDWEKIMGIKPPEATFRLPVPVAGIINMIAELMEQVIDQIVERHLRFEDGRMVYCEKDAAALLSITPRQLREEGLAGRIVACTIAGEIHYTHEDLIDYLKGRQSSESTLAGSDIALT